MKRRRPLWFASTLVEYGLYRRTPCRCGVSLSLSRGTRGRVGSKSYELQTSAPHLQERRSVSTKGVGAPGRIELLLCMGRQSSDEPGVVGVVAVDCFSPGYREAYPSGSDRGRQAVLANAPLPPRK